MDDFNFDLVEKSAKQICILYIDKYNVEPINTNLVEPSSQNNPEENHSFIHNCLPIQSVKQKSTTVVDRSKNV